jgi:uncharacterized protein
MAELLIHVPDIESEGKHYEFPLELRWMTSALEATDLRPDPSATGRLDVIAQRSGDDILVTGKIHTRIFADCVRCLEDAPVFVDVELGSLFTARGEAHRAVADELDLTPEEIAQEFFVGDDIALDELVRETIILEVPMQPLCREDCPGIPVPEHVRPPADFGDPEGSKGVDPRLEGLKKIKNQMFSKQKSQQKSEKE